jgi:hypothetical protein
MELNPPTERRPKPLWWEKNHKGKPWAKETQQAWRDRLVLERNWEEFEDRMAYHEARGLDKKQAYWLARMDLWEPEDARPSSKKDVFKGKKALHPENIRWVAESIAIDDVHQADAPSSTAWGLLQWVIKSPANQATFWTQIYTKLVPVKAREEGDKLADDGGLIALLEEVERASQEAMDGRVSVLPPSPEGDDGERKISPEALEAGREE